MKTHAHLTAIAHNHYHPTKTTTTKTDWKLYYGDSNRVWYGPTTYVFCMAEQKRQIALNSRLKKEFFKIK